MKVKYSEFTFIWLINYIQRVIKPVINTEYFTENENVHSNDFSNGVYQCTLNYRKFIKIKIRHH